MSAPRHIELPLQAGTKQDDAQRKTVSIIIPALNEEDGISGTVSAIPVHRLVNDGYKVEIIVVDNGSTDETSERARAAGARVVAEPNRGYGRAHKRGYEEAKGDYIVVLDADQTYPAEIIPDVIRRMDNEEIEFVTTNRFAMLEAGAMSARNRIGNHVLSFLSRIVSGLAIKDYQSGMWFISKGVLNRIELEEDGMPLSNEIKLKAAYASKQWTEMPIRYARRTGETKLRAFHDSLATLKFLVKFRYRGKNRIARVTAVPANSNMVQKKVDTEGIRG